MKPHIVLTTLMTALAKGCSLIVEEKENAPVSTEDTDTVSDSRGFAHDTEQPASDDNLTFVDGAVSDGTSTTLLPDRQWHGRIHYHHCPEISTL